MYFLVLVVHSWGPWLVTNDHVMLVQRVVLASTSAVVVGGGGWCYVRRSSIYQAECVGTRVINQYVETL